MTDQTPTQGLEPSEASSVIFTPGTKLREIERIVILETLKQKSFNRTHTARALGIGIRTLQRKLKRYGASDWGLKTWKAASPVDAATPTTPSIESVESAPVTTPAN